MFRNSLINRKDRKNRTRRRLRRLPLERLESRTVLSAIPLVDFATPPDPTFSEAPAFVSVGYGDDGEGFIPHPPNCPCCMGMLSNQDIAYWSTFDDSGSLGDSHSLQGSDVGESDTAEIAETTFADELTLADTFQLHSNPGASHTIYLDFDGHVTSGTIWNSAFNGGNDIVTPAYNFQGDSSSFTDTELQRIQRIWQRVAEDFLPFDVNVTTEEPAPSKLRKSSSSDTEWGVRVVIGGNGSWYGNAGGVAYVGSFNWSSDTPVFVFSENLGNGHEKYTAEAITHEAGHALGLRHHGRTSPSEEYYAGHGSGETGWAPIMGVGYYRNLTQWSRGEYANANRSSQDDLQIITTENGFGYRTDDHGDDFQTATEFIVDQSTVFQTGIIERNDDVDMFSFTTTGGEVDLSFSPAPRGPNLNIGAALYDAVGTLLVYSNPTGILSASIAATLAAGEYFVSVTGTGEGDPLNGGFSDYGSLGWYSISGTIPQGETPDPPVLTAANDSFTLAEDSPATVLDVLANDSSDPDGPLTIAAVTQGSQGGTITINAGQSVSYAPLADFYGSETFTYTITDGTPGNTATATVTVTVTPVADIVDDTATTERDQPVTIDVLANDGFSGDPEITAVTQGSSGAVAITGDNRVTYTPNAGFVGVDSFTYTVTSGGVTETGTVTVTVSDPDQTWPIINFNDYVVGPYGYNQDVDGFFAVEDDGATLRIWGNSWKRIEMPYVVTPDTVLEFDFRSPRQGEIHGIGFDTTLNLDASKAFKLYGTQAWGIGDFENYADTAPGWKHYRIPVGQFYTGSFRYLFFSNDHDVRNADADAYWSNIRVYEDVAPPVVSLAANDDSFVIDGDSSDNILDVLANDEVLNGDSDGMTITSVGLGSAGGAITIVDGKQLSYTPQPGFTGQETFVYTLSHAPSGLSDTATVTVDVRDISGVLDFREFTVGSYGFTQDVDGFFAVEDSGTTLRIWGNSWKQIEMPYVVTPDTVLEFDFRSPSQGEIHGIGFDTTLNLNSNLTFKVYGTQAWGRSDFENYADTAPGWKHYRIPIGQFYTGSFRYMFFSNDHDVRNADAEAYWSNIRVYEETIRQEPSISVTANDDAFVVEPGSANNSFDVLANDVIEGGNSGDLRIASVSSPSAGGSVTIVDGALIEYTPLPGFMGAETFTYTITDASGEWSGTATVSVTVEETSSAVDFREFVVGSYGFTQDVDGFFAVEDSGATLRIWGNSWKQIEMPYEVTPDTVLEFDFRSPRQGEIHAIGFDTTLNLNSNLAFKLYGTQAWGRSDFENYADTAPGWKHYRIPIGQFYTGSFRYLFFSNDHDVQNADAEAYWSNIRVYEDVPQSSLVAPSVSSASSDEEAGGLDELVGLPPDSAQGPGQGARTPPDVVGQTRDRDAALTSLFGSRLSDTRRDQHVEDLLDRLDGLMSLLARDVRRGR